MFTNTVKDTDTPTLKKNTKKINEEKKHLETSLGKLQTWSLQLSFPGGFVKSKTIRQYSQSTANHKSSLKPCIQSLYWDSVTGCLHGWSSVSHSHRGQAAAVGFKASTVSPLSNHLMWVT